MCQMFVLQNCSSTVFAQGLTRVSREGSFSYTVQSCNASGVSVCGDWQAPMLHVLPSPIPGCLCKLPAARFVEWSGDGFESSTLTHDYPAATPLVFIEGKWSIWVEAIFTCGVDVTLSEMDGALKLSHGSEVAFDLELRPSCILLSPEIFAAVALHHNLTCSPQWCVSDFDRVITLTFAPNATSNSGIFVISLSQSRAFCMRQLPGSVAKVVLNPVVLLRNQFAIDRWENTLHLGKDLKNTVSADDNCAAREVCTTDQVYMPQTNSCIDVGCAALWFKEVDPISHVCRLRPAVVAIVILFLTAIVVSECCSVTVERRLQKALAETT
jgi:hypothetical protein